MPLSTPSPGPAAPLFPATCTHHRVDVGGGLQIACTVGGAGPALAAVARPSANPRHLAPGRAGPGRAPHVVAADLRGYGESSKPAATPDHAALQQARDGARPVALMRHWASTRFDVLAHDRGARVAHRLALDHPHAVRRLALLDIAPTLAMYEQTTEAFARAYWHWFFLIQPAPLPERLIEADPAAYVRDVMGRRSAGLAPFDPRALAEYRAAWPCPAPRTAMCEDYRAAAGIDLEHDRADRDAGRQVQVPLLACGARRAW